MSKTNTGLVAYAKAQVGLPYWYGTFGQTASASLYASKKAQYPSYYTATDFASQYGKRVHDCCGLIKGYIWSSSATATPTYNSAQDKSASGMYAAATTKGAISTFPKKAGQLVFKGTTAAKITHVGVYSGDGYVYEAKGHQYGVVKTAYQASDWQYWAQCPYITDDTETTASNTSTKAAQTTTAEPKTIWDFLLGKLGNAYGVTGIMGNLYAESALIPNNLQNSYESKLGYTDKTYTDAVDNGTYSNFSKDSAGYGLAQWTYSTRKAALLAYATAQNASIGNLSMQLNFLWKEMSESYASLVTTLKNATSVTEASTAVLTKYEKPADQGSTVQAKRASYGQGYYDTYAGNSSTGSTSSSAASSASGTTHTVVKGDTLSALAKKYGTTVSAIVAANKSKYSTITASYIVVGWVLTIPTSTTSSGTSTTTTQTATITTLQSAPNKESGYSSGKKYKTTAKLNLRYGPSADKLSNGKDKYGIITTLALGAVVTYYGYYATTNGVKWLYVAVNGKTGWVSSAYLKAV